MKSDYVILCEKYKKLLEENKELKKENDTLFLEIENKKSLCLENEILKQEVFELKLLLHKKVYKIIDEKSR